MNWMCDDWRVIHPTDNRLILQLHSYYLSRLKPVRPTPRLLIQRILNYEVQFLLNKDPQKPVNNLARNVFKSLELVSV